MIGSPLATRRGDLPRFEGEELVVVTSPMFPHKIGKGYDNPLTKVVKEVNGVPIKNLRHLVEVLRDSKEKFTTIRFDDKASETIVFNHQEALKATEEILSDNGIRQQASDDLDGGLVQEEVISMIEDVPSTRPPERSRRPMRC